MCGRIIFSSYLRTWHTFRWQTFSHRWDWGPLQILSSWFSGAESWECSLLWSVVLSPEKLFDVSEHPECMVAHRERTEKKLKVVFCDAVVQLPGDFFYIEPRALQSTFMWFWINKFINKITQVEFQPEYFRWQFSKAPCGLLGVFQGDREVQSTLTSIVRCCLPFSPYWHLYWWY